MPITPQTPQDKPHSHKWSLTGPDFTGPREDVVATIERMQSIPDEFAVSVVAAINAMDKTVRGVRLNLHYTNTGQEFHINGHCTKIF
jgi:hypothetical protein